MGKRKRMGMSLLLGSGLLVHAAWLNTLERITRSLWDELLGPIATALGEPRFADGKAAGRLVLVPVGLLAKAALGQWLVIYLRGSG